VNDGRSIVIHEVKGWRVGEKEKQVHPSGEQAYTNLWKRIGMSVVPAERKTGHGTGCVGARCGVAPVEKNRAATDGPRL